MEETDGPPSFADLGINVSNSTIDTCFGKIRRCETLSKLEVVFLVISLLSLLGALGLTIERLISSPKDSADFTFALVLILNICFCFYYVVNGIFFERPHQIGILVLATAVVCLNIVLNFVISTKGPFKLARLIISSVLSPCVIAMGVQLAKQYLESKNLIFRTVGAQVSFQDLCKTMFVFFDLLQADLQVSWTLALLNLTSGQKVDLEYKILLPLSLVFGIASFLSGYLASIEELHKPERNHVLSIVATFTSVLMIFVWIITCVGFYLAYRNFGKGLNDFKRHTPPERQRLLESTVQQSDIFITSEAIKNQCVTIEATTQARHRWFIYPDRNQALKYLFAPVLTLNIFLTATTPDDD